MEFKIATPTKTNVHHCLTYQIVARRCLSIWRYLQLCSDTITCMEATITFTWPKMSGQKAILCTNKSLKNTPKTKGYRCVMRSCVHYAPLEESGLRRDIVLPGIVLTLRPIHTARSDSTRWNRRVGPAVERLSPFVFSYSVNGHCSNFPPTSLESPRVQFRGRDRTRKFCRDRVRRCDLGVGLKCNHKEKQKETNVKVILE